jgi:hypothetical protein
MRKVFTAVAGGVLAVTLSAPAAHAAPPASKAQPVHLASHHDRGDDGGDDGDDDHYYHHGHHCHGLVTRLLCWLV